MPVDFKKLANTLRELSIDASQLDDLSKDVLAEMQRINPSLRICRNAKEVIARNNESRNHKSLGTSKGFRVGSF